MVNVDLELPAAQSSSSNQDHHLRTNCYPLSSFPEAAPIPLSQSPKMLSSLQNPRQAAAQLMNFGLILSTAFMVRLATLVAEHNFLGLPRLFSGTPCSSVADLSRQMWKGLSVITDSPSPIVVVLSGSMEPAFQRGDLLLLWNRNFFSETNVGEIVVYNVKGKDIPIVHRVVRKFGVGLVLLHRGDDTRVGADSSSQTRSEASYKGRQQRGGRHRTLRSWTGLLEQEGYCRVRALLPPCASPLTGIANAE